MTTIKIGFGLLLIGIVSIIAGYFLDISICAFYNITGVPCPSCGLTRAMLALSEGNISLAFHYHPLWSFVILIPLLFGFHKKMPARTVTIMAGGIIALFVLVWILRLIFLFPHTEPMVFRKQSLFYWLYQHIAA